MASLTVNAPGSSLDAAAHGAHMEQRTELQGSWPPHGSSGAAPSAPPSAQPPAASGGSAPLLAVSALPAEASRRFDALLAGEELPDQRPTRPLGSALAAALAGAPRVARCAPSLPALRERAQNRKMRRGERAAAQRAGAAARRFLGAARSVTAENARLARFRCIR
jgi:hypothetical protein